MFANFKSLFLTLLCANASYLEATAQEIVTGSNGKLGFKNELEKLILPTEYDFIDVGMGDLFRLRFIAKKINPNTQDKVLSFAEEIYNFSKDYQYGILETDYNLLIPCQYQRFLLFSDNMALGQRSDNTWDGYAFSFSNKKAHLKKVFQKKYTHIKMLFSDNEGIALFNIEQKTLKGVASWTPKQGWQELIKPEYTQLEIIAQDAYNGICFAQKQGKWSILDILGKKIVPQSYDNFTVVNAEAEPDKLVIVQQDNKKGLYHYYGERYLNLLLKPDFEDIIPNFTKQTALVKQKGKWGFLTNIMETQKGEKLTWTLPLEYDSIQNNEDGSLSVKKDNRTGTFNPSTQQIDWQ